ncbi:MAG: hypothetical protein AABX93_03620 [Nanoarchaeota archaeon]
MADYSEIAKYAFGAAVIWSITKYIGGPLLGTNVTKMVERISRDVFRSYENIYKSVLEKRADATNVMVSSGRTDKEISDFLDKNFPWPAEPSSEMESGLKKIINE